MEEKEYCRWIYRPGTNNSHFAVIGCKKQINYLSKIWNEKEQCEGVADVYNNRLCPVCERPIKMDYCIVKKEEI